MSSKHNPWSRALCLAYIVSISVLLAATPSRADSDDHSYLPPWMRSEANAAADRSEKTDPPKAARDEAQAPVADAQLIKIAEPPPSNFTARITQAKAKVTKFVSNLFSSSMSFARGE
jgi:hypothetical protein